MSTSSDRFYRPHAWVTWLFFGVGLLGIGIFAGGAFQDPQRAWGNLLLASYYFVGLGLGGALLVSLFYVTGARWSDVLQRVPEAMTALLPAGAVGLVFVLLLRPTLFPWFNQAMAAGSDLSPFQKVWFDRPFFLGRTLVYVLLWLAFVFALVRRSRREENSDVESPSSKSVALAALFLVMFAVTCWLASTDWIMSLEPRWSSTIFGLYNFAGIFVTVFAAVSVAVVCLHWRGAFAGLLTSSHFHDLGTLLFSFSSFWMYIWFCQYMLIWYVNNPEETTYFRLRQQPGWQQLMLVNLALNWGVPFLVLLFRRAKESPGVLLLVATSLLIGRWVDLYLMILPPLQSQAPFSGAWEAGLVLAALGVAVILFRRALTWAPLVPKLLTEARED
jgi:hypothetical protein